MRIAHVPYTSKHVTTLDLVRPDEVLYRDETWPRPQLGSLQPSAVIGGTPVVAGEAEADRDKNNNSSDHSDKMGAPLEEHGETGPLVPCKVSGDVKSSYIYINIYKTIYKNIYINIYKNIY